MLFPVCLGSNSAVLGSQSLWEGGGGVLLRKQNRWFAGPRALEAEDSQAGTGGVGKIPWAVSAEKPYHLEPSRSSAPPAYGYF